MPGGELMGRDSVLLAYCGSMAGIGLKNTRASMGALFIGWDYQKWGPGDDMHSVITPHMTSAGILG